MDSANHVSIFNSVDKTEAALLKDRFKPRSFKKGEMLTVPGQVQRELYFVKSGVQMSYVDTPQKTHVIAFTYAPDLCAIPESFFLQKPSQHFLSCLSDSELDAITFEDLQQVFNASTAIERLFRKMTEAVLVGVINRHVELHSLTMEERYKAFCQRSAHLLQLVPHKYIASYLGIDPTNFSKLYNSIRY